MLHVKWFNSINAATGANDLVSPLATVVVDGTNQRVLCSNFGNNVEVQIVGNTLDNLVIQRKVSLKTFKINMYPSTKTYQCVDGMTWGEWVSSEYNVDNYVITHDWMDFIKPSAKSTAYVGAEGTYGSPVQPNEVIDCTKEYYHDTSPL